MFPALLAAGVGLEIYGAIKSAQDQSDLDREKARIQNEQADEVLSREKINDAQMQETALRTKLQFGAQFASSGHEGIGIGSQLEIQRQTDVQQSMNDREADFQAKMLREGASMDKKLASETMESGYFNAAASALGTYGRLSQPSAGLTPPNKAQSLPPHPEGY